MRGTCAPLDSASIGSDEPPESEPLLVIAGEYKPGCIPYQDGGGLGVVDQGRGLIGQE